VAVADLDVLFYRIVKKDIYLGADQGWSASMCMRSMHGMSEGHTPDPP